MANSCAVLTGSGPVALGLDSLFASKVFGPDKDVLDGLRSPECDHYILVGQWSGGTGSIQYWPMFGNNSFIGGLHLLFVVIDINAVSLFLTSNGFNSESLEMSEVDCQPSTTMSLM